MLDILMTINSPSEPEMRVKSKYTFIVLNNKIMITLHNLSYMVKEDLDFFSAISSLLTKACTTMSMFYNAEVALNYVWLVNT